MTSCIRRRVFAAALVLSCMGADASAVDTSATDPVAIMEAVEARDRGDRITGRTEMVITDGDNGRSRTRSMHTWTMDFGEDRRDLMLFDSPSDVRNTGLLSFDHDASAQDDDQWLYLPSIHKATRISGSQKSGSFMGSDLTYNDMTTFRVADYELSLLGADTVVQGESVWVIEAVPASPKVKKETGYAKLRVWVSKEKEMVLQAQMWLSDGRKMKYVQFSDNRNIDGAWITHRIDARTVRNDETLSTTVLTLYDIQCNQDAVVKDLFTIRRLEQGL